MDTEINNNGFEYVDFGLPSGTLWATMNVGASKPSDFGLYFQWGDTQGYTKEQVGKDKQFTWKDYKFSIDGSDTNFSNYTKEGAILDLEDDAAHVNMAGDWHMPTYEQIKELMGGTTNEWSTIDGIEGMKFTSKNDESKFIFIPAAGNAWNGCLRCMGYNGYVWSSMLSANNVRYGKYLYFLLGDAYLNSYVRYGGRSVRGVIG